VRPHRDTHDEGQLDGLVGPRQWPCHTDALWIHDRTDTLALRLLADTPGARGGLVWHRSGPLADTTAALLELPAPGQPGAPTLILARSLLDEPTQLCGEPHGCTPAPRHRDP